MLDYYPFSSKQNNPETTIIPHKLLEIIVSKILHALKGEGTCQKKGDIDEHFDHIS